MKTALSLADAHCHLQDPRLAPRLDAVMASAGDAGVETLVCCGTSEADWPLVAGLAWRWRQVIPCFGLHPWHLRDRSDTWLDALRRHLGSAPSGVGEIGLDFAMADSDRAEQEAVFLAQWRVSVELGIPASLHCRKAFGRLLELLQGEGSHPAGFLLHSYGGGPELVQPFLDLGAYFSFGGTLTRSGNKRGPRAAGAIPLDRLLSETDAPDLPPVIDGQLVDQSEPVHVRHVVARLAELRGLPVETMAAAVDANTRRLFAPVLETRA